MVFYVNDTLNFLHSFRDHESDLSAVDFANSITQHDRIQADTAIVLITFECRVNIPSYQSQNTGTGV